MKRALFAAPLLALGLLAGCGNNNFALHGSLSVPGTMHDGTCETMPGYSDISTGTSVVVTDAAGVVVATSFLGSPQRGTVTTTLGVGGIEGAVEACTFPFTVNIPAGSEFYGIEVSHRGVVTVPAAQARSLGVALTLG